jgi:hypothetical protein
MVHDCSLDALEDARASPHLRDEDAKARQLSAYSLEDLRLARLELLPVRPRVPPSVPDLLAHPSPGRVDVQHVVLTVAVFAGVILEAGGERATGDPGEVDQVAVLVFEGLKVDPGFLGE